MSFLFGRKTDHQNKSKVKLKCIKLFFRAMVVHVQVFWKKSISFFLTYFSLKKTAASAENVKGGGEDFVNGSFNGTGDGVSRVKDLTDQQWPKSSGKGPLEIGPYQPRNQFRDLLLMPYFECLVDHACMLDDEKRFITGDHNGSICVWDSEVRSASFSREQVDLLASILFYSRTEFYFSDSIFISRRSLEL